jgi:hypothetical protein
MENKRVFCEVRKQCLCIIYINLKLQKFIITFMT